MCCGEGSVSVLIEPVIIEWIVVQPDPWVHLPLPVQPIDPDALPFDEAPDEGIDK
jgi:hypothetical protein